jgi:transposase
VWKRVFAITVVIARMFDHGAMSEHQRRYPSDLSDREWALIEPLLPPARSGGPKGGRPPAPRRDVVDAICYLVRTGCSWRQLPGDFPPWRTVYGYFAAWKADGTLARLHDSLRDQIRAVEQRAAEPTAGIVDAQVVRGADTVGAENRGYDAAKKTNGRKRHVVVDTLGLLLVVIVTAASTQDRDGGRLVVERVLGAHPGLRLVWADAGYAGRLVAWARNTAGLIIDIVRRRDGQRGFEVLPRRWVVERTFAWIMKCRRLSADYERTTLHAEAMVQWAMVGLMARRLARRRDPHVTCYNWR